MANPQTILGSLLLRAQEAPLAPAILAPDRASLRYEALAAQMLRSIADLNGWGLGAKDRIAVALPAGPEYPTALVSVMAGFVCVPLNPGYSVEEARSALENVRATALITCSAEVPDAVVAARQCRIPVIELERLSAEAAGSFRLHSALPRSRKSPVAPDARDVAVIFSTSGSTARPKLIPLTQSMMCERARRARHCVDLTSADLCLDLIPSFHGGAMRVSVLGSLFAGAGSIYPGELAPVDFERCVAEMRPTWCAVPPPFLEMLVSDSLLDAGAKTLPGLRAFFTTGAPVAGETVDKIEAKFGVPVQNYYGAAECGGIAVNPMPPKARKRGSVGVSIGPEIMLLDEHGNPVLTGRVGEVLVRGPGVFAGYESRGETNQPSPFMHDWYRTGDRGYLDTDGYLFLTGRLGTAINRGGEKISPEEIEQVLRRHHAVKDAVVFPLPHATLGEEVAALVVAKPEARVSAEDVRRFAGDHMIASKLPRVVLVVDAIPLGPAGKVQRSQLAAQFADAISLAEKRREHADRKPRSAAELTIAGIWQRVLRQDDLGLTERFFDLGGTSLQAANMFAQVERSFSRSVPMAQFWESPTIGNLARLMVTAEPAKTSLIVPIQTSGSKPPLFYVLPGWYISEPETIARHLGPDQPFYALVPDPRPAGNQAGMTREQILAECVAAIENVQPEGPVSLVGRSIGGHVALDIAHALRRQGRGVALVGLVDSRYPGPFDLSRPLAFLQSSTARLAEISKTDSKAYLRALPGILSRLPRRGAGYLRRRFRKERHLNEIETEAFYTRLERVFYEEPQRWPGRLVYFAAEQSRYRGVLDHRWFWSKAAEEGLEVHLIPGTHDLMVMEPHVRHLASALKGCLERATKT